MSERAGDRRRHAAAALVASLGLVVAVPVARSDVFHTPRELLASHFSGSDHVGFVRVRPEGAARARIERRLGRRLGAGPFVFYRATTGGRPDGYALFDSERGQHELIDIGTFFGPEGAVRRVEVLAFREPYGDGVRSPRFLRQFVGTRASSPLRVGRDIDAISGATISSHSVARAVRRAAVLLEEAVLPAGTDSLTMR